MMKLTGQEITIGFNVPPFIGIVWLIFEYCRWKDGEVEISVSLHDRGSLVDAVGGEQIISIQEYQIFSEALFNADISTGTSTLRFAIA